MTTSGWAAVGCGGCSSKALAEFWGTKWGWASRRSWRCTLVGWRACSAETSLGLGLGLVLVLVLVLVLELELELELAEEEGPRPCFWWSALPLFCSTG